MRWFIEDTWRIAKESAFEYFIPVVLLWRYLNAPEGATTISIKPPKSWGLT